MCSSGVFVGHLRKKQVLQYGFSCTIGEGGVTGAVPSGSVGPKIATTGNPTAAATCIAPESFPTNAVQRENIAGRSAISVFPVKSNAGRVQLGWGSAGTAGPRGA